MPLTQTDRLLSNVIFLVTIPLLCLFVFLLNFSIQDTSAANVGFRCAADAAAGESSS